VIATVQDGFTPLHFASQEGHIDSMRELLLKNADVHSKDKVCGCIVESGEEEW